ncbi:TPA: precorrin-4 C(11)-methyltransferase [Pseudomonas aeruginosa]|nr:precorrin-4 C(11)-methyltransferase [Pseudomonas aeruginosa]HBN8360790.1 precorrin-4 C(11)-methyltransferase [Pseudomonas aeruginosa]HCI2467027.1 precorrin-4 C(11)-methyltransferase [Pseudomonas aeruginosa]HCR1813120.1 precorrin-4 C(11)-methyltransferase [Pseudomonas aeruginosa]HDY6071686.1 precorrin-4 C(11)-methyltransferase [Pseudomonas aeruginosa]
MPLPIPSLLIAGIGCRRGCSAEHLRALLERTLGEYGRSLAELDALASIDGKRDEPGLRQLATLLERPVHFLAPAVLHDYEPRLLSPSAVALRETGCSSVAEAAALALAERLGGGRADLLGAKRSDDRASIALAPSHRTRTPMTVYFIGAGPGDPDLITVKGQRLIRQCPVILYAGSLVPQALLEGHQAGQVVNTAELDLEQIVELLAQAHRRGLDVARVHSGDPSLYGAIGEQIRHLRELGIPYEIVPGVTATAACAALLGCELTLPEVSQTLILTRYAARTKMPEGESLGDLARHRATLAIHLGVAHLAKIVEELLPHYGADCPVAVIHRASWPDQEQVRGTLGDILPKVAARNFRRTALILVGEVLAAEGFADSSLYRAEHRHLYRPGE